MPSNSATQCVILKIVGFQFGIIQSLQRSPVPQSNILTRTFLPFLTARQLYCTIFMRVFSTSSEEWAVIISCKSDYITCPKNHHKVFHTLTPRHRCAPPSTPKYTLIQIQKRLKNSTIYFILGCSHSIIFLFNENRPQKLLIMGPNIFFQC